LRTADSGYLTRRLVDVSQDVIIRDEDCKTKDYIELPIHVPGEGLNKSLLGRMVAEDVHNLKKDGTPGAKVLLEKGTLIRTDVLRQLEELFEGEPLEAVLIPVRSVLKCRSEYGVCRSCYGTFLGTGQLCEIGDAVGIMAAQSIGEPGTQLTMRTFRTGGVSIAGGDITHGLPRVVEIFEARNPKGAAQLAEISGTVSVGETDRGGIQINLLGESMDKKTDEPEEREYLFPRRT